MATLQHLALKAIAGEQEDQFAFCEEHGIYFHTYEPPYLTMGRIASWVLLMKNVEVTKLPGTKIPKICGQTISGDITVTLQPEGWESGRQDTPMSEGGQA
jgi:hypothetical protein